MKHLGSDSNPDVNRVSCRRAPQSKRCAEDTAWLRFVRSAFSERWIRGEPGGSSSDGAVLGSGGAILENETPRARVSWIRTPAHSSSPGSSGPLLLPVLEGRSERQKRREPAICTRTNRILAWSHGAT